MDINTFKNKLDNRDFWGTQNQEVFNAAYDWANEQNSTSKNTCEWSWDCGLKLDYDGDIVKISSRFYPPHKSHENYGMYHGIIHVYLVGEKIHSKEVESKTLDDLKLIVENYVSEIENKIYNHLGSLLL